MEPGTDSAVVVRGIIKNTAVIAGGLDTVVAAMAELHTGVAVGTGTAVVEGGLGTDIALEEQLGIDTSLVVPGLGTGVVEGPGMDSYSEVSWEIEFVVDKLKFDWLGCKVAEGQGSCAVVVLQRLHQVTTADQRDHSTTGYRRLEHIVRQRNNLGTSYQFGPLLT